uniref:AIG1-type G domain-containing protein n=1 Tax=Sinocyclocheilus grahami TaxID=75366 RepID=A0A672R5A2_SINGR
MYINTEQRDADCKQLIERAGKELDALIQKCENRVHVFNYTDSRGINVQKLFHEIENLVARHVGQSFKTDPENYFPELRIVLMGARIVGKTSNRTKTSVMRKDKVNKRNIILIDTPGWWPYAAVKETSESVKQEIMSSVTMCSPGPHAVLLVLQSGVAFSKAYGRSVNEHIELLGRNVWRHCLVVFTRGDWMGTPTIEEHIESEGGALQWLINKCGNRYHVLNNMQWDDGKQVSEVMEKVEMMARGNTDLLTPVEEAEKESDSGWGSNKSDQDQLERGSVDLVPPESKSDKLPAE